MKKLAIVLAAFVLCVLGMGGVASAAASVIRGTQGPDVIVGTDARDIIYAGPGDDTVYPGAGPDIVYLGTGTNTIYAQDGEQDIIYCGPDGDLVYADTIDILHGCAYGTVIYPEPVAVGSVRMR